MQKISYIGIHHSGGLLNNPYAPTSHLTEQHINNAHKSRWPDFPSQLNGSFIGYNIIIWPQGNWKQYRYVGEDTAAAKGWNSNTFHICLMGNNLVEKHTEAQIKTLKEILKAATNYDTFPDLCKMGIKIASGTELKMSMFRIYGHRAFQPTTECNALPDDWARNLLWEDYNTATKNIFKFIQSFCFGTPSTSLGSSQTERGCAGYL